MNPLHIMNLLYNVIGLVLHSISFAIYCISKQEPFITLPLKFAQSCALLQNMELATKDKNMRYLAFFQSTTHKGLLQDTVTIESIASMTNHVIDCFDPKAITHIVFT